MSADESRHLYFLVHGDPRVLSVHADANGDINDLKKTIINEACLDYLKTSDVIRGYSSLKLRDSTTIEPVGSLTARLPYGCSAGRLSQKSG